MVMKLGTWDKLNAIDENLYEAKALLDVMSDGLCNEIVAVSNDSYATAVRLIYEKIEKAIDANQELFKVYRGDEDEKPSDEWKEWEGETPLWPDDREVELAFQDTGGEEDSSEVVQGESSTGYEKFTGVSLEMTEEHPDGSATFVVSGSRENIQAVMSASFCSLITRGIAHMEEETAVLTEKSKRAEKVMIAAKQLNDILIQWETDEDLDYDPHVKMFRETLTELLQVKA
jgi:hypothetical protein